MTAAFLYAADASERVQGGRVAGSGAGPTLVTIVLGLVGFGLPSSFSELALLDEGRQ